MSVWQKRILPAIVATTSLETLGRISLTAEFIATFRASSWYANGRGSRLKKPDDRQQRRNDLRDRVKRGLQQLTTEIAEWRADRRAEWRGERVSGESDSGQSEEP